jgi:NOL1/NOP2/fmu family ribosome biogenesis protein
VKYWGWWLGTFKNDKFIPSPGLLAALPKEDFQKVLEFSLDDPDLKLFQRGSPFSSNFNEMKSDGWVVIAVDGFPLGWGKLKNGKIKSYLPNWLRR